MGLTKILNNNTDSGLSSLKWHTLRQSIVKCLLSVGDVTIAELSTELQASVPTITKAINELVQEGIVSDVGKVANSGGRRPSLYSIKATSAYFLGVEMNRSSMSIGLQDLKGEFVNIELRLSFVLENTNESLLEFCKLINDFIDNTDVDRSKIVGVCINLSGRINSKEGFSYNYFFSENTPLSEIIESQLNLPVYLENDSRGMAFGEYTQGVVDGEQNVLFLNFSWGVGMGIITDGKLYYGKSGYSGEFGHSAIFDNEKLCHCGKLGCLETEVSGWSLVQQFQEALSEGKKSLVTLDDTSPIHQYYSILNGALAHEDGLCIDLITTQSVKMGHYLSILLNIFNPELVIIGGDLSQLGDLVLLPIQSSLRKYSLGLVNRDMTLKKSALGRRAGVIGACQIVRERMLSVNQALSNI